MHRSGTSAVTGALGGLGLQMPRVGDRMDEKSSNPEHWESLSLGLHDESLLRGLGGSWDAPPDLPVHWLHTVAVLGGNRSGATLAEAYPDAGPAAFKDPRVCLLLPHWRTVLPAPVAALLVWREPLDVAYSLRRRDGLPLASGLALWERYNRSALSGLAGVDTRVVQYEDVVADPAAAVSSWAAWLGSLAPFVPYRSGWDTARAAGAIAPSLRHQAGPTGSEGRALLSLEQQRLADRLHHLAGTHDPLPSIDLGDETPWATALVATRREATRERALATASRQRFWAVRSDWAESRTEATGARLAASEAARERDRMEAERDGAREELAGAREELAGARAALAEAQAMLAQLYRSTSWKATRPLRSSVARMERWGRRPSGPGR
jgi:hypothetical protein